MQFASPVPAKGVWGCMECCSPEVAALQVREVWRDAPEPVRHLQDLALVGLVH